MTDRVLVLLIKNENIITQNTFSYNTGFQGEVLPTSLQKDLHNNNYFTSNTEYLWYEYVLLYDKL